MRSSLGSPTFTVSDNRAEQPFDPVTGARPSVVPVALTIALAPTDWIAEKNPADGVGEVVTGACTVFRRAPTNAGCAPARALNPVPGRSSG